MPEQPDLILTPFGENAPSGAIETIPEQRSPGDPPQRASWQDGFPTVTMQPLSSGGIPPRGQDFNGVLNAITKHTVYQEGGGQYKWSQEWVDAKGGYAKGSVLQSDDGLTAYVSTKDNNTSNFNTTPAAIGTDWEVYSGPTSAPGWWDRYASSIGKALATAETERDGREAVDAEMAPYNSVQEFIESEPDAEAVRIVSYYGGWAATVEGPRGGFTAHRTGYTADSPSVGDPVAPATIGTGDQAGLFWTADGAEWEISPSENSVDISQFGCVIGNLSHDSADALENAFAFMVRTGATLTGGSGRLYCARPVTIYPAETVSNASVDIRTLFVFPDGSDGFSIGNFNISDLRFAGFVTVSEGTDGTAGVGFTKGTMRDCDLRVDWIEGFQHGFYNTSQAADYFNRIKLGRVRCSRTSGVCVTIDTEYYSNENELTTKFMAGWKGIVGTDISGQTFTEFSGWKFLNPGFENIAHTAYEPKSFGACALLWPRFEGGSEPSEYWINEDATNKRSTYILTHDIKHSMLNLGGLYPLFYGRVLSDSGTVLYDGLSSSARGPIVRTGNNKTSETPSYTHVWRSNLGVDMGLWERWAGYVVDGNGDFRRYGLLDPYGVQIIGNVAGEHDVDAYASHVTLSTSAGAVILICPLRKEFEGYHWELEIKTFSNDIAIKKSTGATTISAGEITASGVYKILYRGGSWTWTRIGDAYT